MTHRRPAAPSGAPIVGPPARYARRIVTHLQESDLVAAAKRGDRAALDHLLRLHYDRVHGICRRIAGRTRDGDDACQEAMIKIVRNLHRFDERSSFGTWVYRIATNAALDELRKRQRRPALHVADDGASNEPADPASEERIAAVGDRRAIDDAVAGRPFDPGLLGSLDNLASRGYTDGFFQRHQPQDYQNYIDSHSRSVRQRFVGELVGYDAHSGLAEVEVKNKFGVGDRLELIMPQGNRSFRLEAMQDLNGVAMTEAPGGGYRVRIPLATEPPGMALLARHNC